jgi:hypothetical protein
VVAGAATLCEKPSLPCHSMPDPVPGPTVAVPRLDHKDVRKFLFQSVMHGGDEGRYPRVMIWLPSASTGVAVDSFGRKKLW